ncbi:MAG: NUDIX hydrolase, partial [Anaerolineae bacterium]
LIAPTGSGRWQLPKGLVEGGESAESAASREVAEEAGLEAQVIGRLGEIEYWYRTQEGALHHKFVEFFLMSHVVGDPIPGKGEVDEARWFPVEDAVASLAFDSERQLVVEALRAWQGRQGRSV